MDTLYLAAVCAVVPGLGRSRIPDLINALGSARAVFEASAATLTATGLCTPRAVQNFISNRDARLPQRLDYFCRHNGVQILAYTDAAYPQSLQNLSDKPLVLYVKGELPQANYALAIVGSRRCTEYGVRAAACFAQAMTRDGIPIISGGAKGIDTAAHEACLQAGGDGGSSGLRFGHCLSARKCQTVRPHCRAGRLSDGISAGSSACSGQLSCAQPYYRRSVAGRTGSRGRQAQRRCNYGEHRCR